MVKRYLAVAMLVIMAVGLTGQTALAAPERQGSSVHYVTLGESLSEIAAQYGVSTEAILRYNGLSDPDKIYVGQALQIPGSSYEAPTYTGGYGYSGSSYASSGCGSYHIVQRGDTLSSIARRYGSSIDQLRQANNIYNAHLVRAGQKLCIPQGWSNPQPSYGHYSPPSGAYYHVVTKGETLSTICNRYGVSVWEVLEANYLHDPSYVYPGQKLYIPNYQPQPVIYQPPTVVKETVVVVVEEECPCGSGGPNCNCPPPKPEPEPISVYLRLGRNVTYEYWGRPDYGIDDCAVDWYDDGDPVLRFTAEIILTNQSKYIIPSSWASPQNVIFHTLSGAQRKACKHVYKDSHNGSMDVTFDDIKRLDTSYYPGDLAPDGTVNVTFYTHIEEGDLITKMEFVEFGLCFDPNSGDQIPCAFD